MILKIVLGPAVSAEHGRRCIDHARFSYSCITLLSREWPQPKEAEGKRKNTHGYLLAELDGASPVAQPAPPGSCGYGFGRHCRQRAEGGHQLRRNFQ